jgi:hypothetical protein
MQTLRNVALLIIFLLGVFILYLQFTSPGMHSITEDIDITHKFPLQPVSIQNKDAINNLVYAIAALAVRESNYIGIDGRKSTQPNYLDLLEKQAGIDQLVQLTNHKSSLVRSLAFQALKDKNYTGLKEIFDKHIFDDQTYQYQSGCVIEPIPVNSDLYHCICPLLNKHEAALYKTKLLKKYKDTYFEYFFQYP